MSEEIIKVFDYIGDKLGIVIDYTQENIQPYLEDLWNRFITYELIIHILYVILGIVELTIGFILLFKYLKALKLANDEKADGFFYKVRYSLYDNSSIIELADRSIAVFLFMIFMFISGLALFFTNTVTVIELLIVPEKFMLELVNAC